MQERLAVRAVDVHFVDEQERRDLVAPQKLPQRMGVALHAARAADDQNGIIQHLKRPLHLRRKSTCPGVSSSVTEHSGSGSIACLEKIVMPRSRSSASVSRKASRWSTRPRLRMAPLR